MLRGVNDTLNMRATANKTLTAEFLTNAVHVSAAMVTMNTFFLLLRSNSVVTDVQFGHLFFVYIKYDALQEVTCGVFRKISHCS